MSSEESDDDLHQCGRCMHVFHSILEYFDHKKSKSCSRVRCKHTSDNSSSLKCIQDDGQALLMSKPSGAVPEVVDNGGCFREVGLLSIETFSDETLDAGKMSDSGKSVEAEAERRGSNLPLHVSGEGQSQEIVPDAENRLNESSCLSEELTTGTLQKWKRGRPPKSITYNKAAQLKKQVHWNSKSRLYQCPKCTYVASFKDDYDRHLRKSHNLSAYVCYRCQKAFSDKYKLKRHLQKMCHRGPLQGKVPAFTEFSKKANQCHRLSHSTGDEVLQEIKRVSFLCQICKELCDSYGTILLHMAKHPSIRPGICRFCGLWFSNRYKLRRHVVSSIHDDVADDQMQAFRKEVEKMKIVCPAGLMKSKLHRQPTSCSKCSVTFVSQVAYLQHKERDHPKIGSARSYPCKLCSDSFESRKKYLLHLKSSHRKQASSSSSKYKHCPVCRRRFLHRSHLNRHRLTLHSPRQQMPLAAASKLLTNTAAVTEDNGNDLQNKLAMESSCDKDMAELAYVCFVCQQKFLDINLITEHVELHRVWVPRSAEGRGSADNTYALPVDKTYTALQSINDYQDAAPNNLEEESIIKDKEKIIENIDSAADTFMRKIPPSDSIMPVCGNRVLSKCQFSCPYCCHECDDLETLFDHKTREHSLSCIFRCVVPHCKLVFEVVDEYVEHSKIHLQSSFICKLCNEHFENRRDLFSHRTSAHKQVQPVPNFVGTDGAETSSDQISKSQNEDGQCNCNDETFLTVRANSSEEIDTGRAEDVERVKENLCDKCGSVFESRIALCRHRAKHACGRRYVCGTCNRAFVKNEHLQRHQVSAHTTAKPFVCKEPGCAKAFKRKDKLRDHFKCHSSIKPYSCLVCGKKYRYREGLRYHEKMHEKEHRYKCSECPVSFPRPSELRHHLASVHKLESKKEMYAYHCNICGRVFPRPERLKRHSERDHSIAANWVFRCDVCCKGFPGVKSYETHKMRHHGSADDAVKNNPKQRRSRTTKDLLRKSSKLLVKSFLAKENLEISSLKWPEQQQSPSGNVQLENSSDSPDSSERACEASEIATSADNNGPYYPPSVSQDNDFTHNVSAQLLASSESKVDGFLGQTAGFNSLPSVSPDRRFSGYSYVQTPGYSAVDYASSLGNDCCTIANTEEHHYDSSLQDMVVDSTPESNRILRFSSDQQSSTAAFTNAPALAYPSYPSSRISQQSSSLHPSLGFYNPRSNSYRAGTNAYSFSSDQFSSATISFSFARANTFSHSSNKMTGKTSEFPSGPVPGQFALSDHTGVPFRPVAMPTQPSKPSAANDANRFGRWFSNVPLLANSYDAKQTMFDAVRLSRLPATDRTPTAGHPFSMSCRDPYVTSRYSTERQCIPREPAGNIDQRPVFMDYGFMSDEHAATVRRDDHFGHSGASALHPVSSHIPGTMPAMHMPLSLLSQQQQQFQVNDYQWPTMPMYNWL